MISNAKRPGGHRQRGVALVITLIMLSVITFMAVTFLVLSQRERNSVTTTTHQAIARTAADTALERVKIELIAPMLAFTNPHIYGLIVSTNFYNPDGFYPLAPLVISNDVPIPFSFYYGAFNCNPTNVNYFYTRAGNALTFDERMRNLANLYFNPRPPVVTISTNRAYLTNEFRYYLDLNRNGRHDTNGWIPEVGMDGLPIIVDGVTNYVWCVGDPEWIGILEHPEWPHSSSNRFISRYAYIAIPVGKTLDINYIHNAAKRQSLNAGVDNYFRNQGVGSWEINLAAFLTDLNTNFWYYNHYSAGAPVYNYVTNTPFTVSDGLGFDDAAYMLRFRYGGAYDRLDSVANRYGPRAANSVNFRGADNYSDGDLQTAIGMFPDTDDATLHWSGLENTNTHHFFTTQELFDRAKVSPGLPFVPLVAGFTNRLLDSGTNISTYDRYTFYRMLDQLGFDTAAERGKININSRNVDDFGQIIPGMETNFFAWTNAAVFFTNAVDRILRMNTETWVRENDFDYTNTYGVNTSFGLKTTPNPTDNFGIPVYVPFTHPGTNLITVETNTALRYTAGIHRLLQVVANIYDSTTNRSDLTGYPYLPHVYRPIFRRFETNDDHYIYIVGYREVRDAQIAGIGGPAPVMIDPQLKNGILGRSAIPLMGIPYNTSSSVENDEPMVSGVPLVIGAKKGLPNFNKAGLQTEIQVTRKLQFRRDPGTPVNQTNQVFELGVSNIFGAQAWNSYTTPAGPAVFPRPLQVIVAADITMSMTNESGQFIMGPFGTDMSNTFFLGGSPTVVPAWPAYRPQVTNSFVRPLFTRFAFLTNSFYIQDGTITGTRFVSSASDQWDQANTFRVPHFWLNLRTRMRFIIVDTAQSRIVDYVNLDSTDEPINIMEVLRSEAKCDQIMNNTTTDGGLLWCTNRYPGDPLGTLPDNPLRITYGIWNQMLISLGVVDPPAALWRDFSKSGQKGISVQNFQDWLKDTNAAPNNYDAPFQPTRRLYHYVSWEANDPLVHYTASDLTDLMLFPKRYELDTPTQSVTNNLLGVNRLNKRYFPWPINADISHTFPETQFEITVKDPFMKGSDNWNFPVGLLPSVGWIGRVHRGTPWQTIYMKSEDLSVTNFPSNLTNAIAWARFYPDAAKRWRAWSGNANTNEAYYARPVQDRLLFDIFTAAINDNATRGQLSVNQNGLAAWSAVLSGVVVATDNAGGNTVIQPAALGPGTNSAVETIVRGIHRTRSQTNDVNGDLFPQKLFTHLGDILAVPELTEISPFVDTNLMRDMVAEIPFGGITDEVVERIPQQIMGLLTLNQSPRFVIYAYGQTLQPAPNSIVTANGPYFQMCTNYQVTAESVTRTVLEVEGFNPTNNIPHIRTLQFNPLPPD